MAVSTTQSIWRSGGGDQTRQAYCGTGVMTAGFYVANAAVTGNAVVASSQTGVDVILPANAVVISLTITTPLTSGSINVGYKTVTGIISSAAYYANAAAATTVRTITAGALGNGSGIGIVANATVNTVLTTESASSALGSFAGFITYFVADPYFGEQNV
jgi:hypothetical protein